MEQEIPKPKPTRSKIGIVGNVKTQSVDGFEKMRAVLDWIPDILLYCYFTAVLADTNATTEVGLQPLGIIST